MQCPNVPFFNYDGVPKENTTFGEKCRTAEGAEGVQAVGSYQCNTNIFEYSNIRIIATEYYIFEYEYSIFLFRIYLILVFRQIAKNEYILYSYSAKLLRTNIFHIRIR